MDSRMRPRIGTRIFIAVLTGLVCWPASASAAPSNALPGVNEPTPPANSVELVRPIEPVPYQVPSGGGTDLQDTAVGAGGAALRQADRPALEGAFPEPPNDVPAARTEHTRSYANPDGTLTAEVSAGRLNFQDSAGTWAPIDTALVPDSRVPGFDLRQAANDVGFSASTVSGERPFARLVAGKNAVTLRALDASVGTASRSDDDQRLTFAKVAAGSDLVVRGTPEGFQFSVVLRDRQAAASYRFALHTGGLVARLDGWRVLCGHLGQPLASWRASSRRLRSWSASSTRRPCWTRRETPLTRRPYRFPSTRLRRMLTRVR